VLGSHASPPSGVRHFWQVVLVTSEHWTSGFCFESSSLPQARVTPNEVTVSAVGRIKRRMPFQAMAKLTTFAARSRPFASGGGSGGGCGCRVGAPADPRGVALLVALAGALVARRRRERI
jgi:MYXO-CTERM domain-containing protein